MELAVLGGGKLNSPELVLDDVVVVGSKFVGVVPNPNKKEGAALLEVKGVAAATKAVCPIRWHTLFLNLTSLCKQLVRPLLIFPPSRSDLNLPKLLSFIKNTVNVCRSSDYTSTRNCYQRAVPNFAVYPVPIKKHLISQHGVSFNPFFASTSIGPPSKFSFSSTAAPRSPVLQILSYDFRFPNT